MGLNDLLLKYFPVVIKSSYMTMINFLILLLFPSLYINTNFVARRVVPVVAQPIWLTTIICTITEIFYI